MDAMILAAGVGSRLGRITADTPKALVTVAGVPVLEHVARRLIAAGADRLIINVHHHADQIVEFVRGRDGFGVEVVFSHEPDAPLETGGGLWHAAPWFRRDRPFFLHNVDVLSEIDLQTLYRAHERSAGLATLAMHERRSSRYLLFDDAGLCGRNDTRTGDVTYAREVRGTPHQLAFCGIHVISPELLDRITERGAFSIIDLYLRLAGEGASIGVFDASGSLWLEIGSPERLEQARRHFGP